MAKHELVVVTGAAGFVGSHLCDALLESGYRVRAADRMAAGDAANLGPARGQDRFEYWEGDVSDAAFARRLCDGAAGVLHQAALSGVLASMDDPVRAHRDTCTTTLAMLAAARDAGVRRFLFASSAACYSGDAPLPLTEDAALTPASPYAAAKIAGELYVGAFARMGLEGVCLRYFNVYGPRQPARSHYAGVVSAFARRVLNGEAVTIYGDGEQTRDFIHVSDVVRANLAALQYTGAFGGIPINIATGRRTSINELAASIARQCGRQVSVNHAPARAGEIRHSVADVARAREVLEFAPATELDDGIATVLEWTKK